MAMHNLDCLGLVCPQPVLKVAAKAGSMQAGDLLEVLADCNTFAHDIKTWCERSNKTLLFCRDEGNHKYRAQIQF